MPPFGENRQNSHVSRVLSLQPVPQMKPWEDTEEWKMIPVKKRFIYLFSYLLEKKKIASAFPPLYQKCNWNFFFFFLFYNYGQQRWRSSWSHNFHFFFKGLELKDLFTELRFEISTFAWPCQEYDITKNCMSCFRGTGRSVNHSGHLTLFQPATLTCNPNLQPETCKLHPPEYRVVGKNWREKREVSKTFWPWL